MIEVTMREANHREVRVEPMEDPDKAIPMIAKFLWTFFVREKSLRRSLKRAVPVPLGAEHEDGVDMTCLLYTNGTARLHLFESRSEDLDRVLVEWDGVLETSEGTLHRKVVAFIPRLNIDLKLDLKVDVN